MKASELVEILERPITVLEKAQLIMDAFTAKAPSALNIKPDKPRKKRERRASPEIKGGIPGIADMLREGTPHEQ